MTGQIDSDDARRPFIAADMTKLIAADSFVIDHGKNDHDKADTPRILLQDPDAAKSFEELCNVLTNKTWVAFKKPAGFPAKPRPIMGAWDRVAQEPIELGILAPDEPRAPRRPPDPQERWDKMKAAFLAYIKEPEEAKRLVNWARFQFGMPTVMAMFWGTNKRNNDEDDLQQALDVIGMGHPEFELVFQSAEPFIDNLSAQYLTRRPWKPDEFTVAYIFWAFVKGFRYAEELGSNHVYAVHWLRKRAMHVDVKLEKVGEKYIPGLFPWGLFLSDLVREPMFKFGSDELGEAITRLRPYTTDELDPRKINGWKQAESFVRQGLKMIFPKKLDETDYYKMFSGTLMIGVGLWQVSARMMGIDVHPAVPAISTAIGVSNLWVPKEEINRQISLLVHQSTLSSLIESHRKELEEYFRTYFGIDDLR